ncbi:MAG: aldo/keto reductase [Pleomorphochaeta sp.]
MENFKGKGFEISRLGLGTMRMSVNPATKRNESIKTIHTALDSGINLINIGDFYGINGHNEKLLGAALIGRKRDEAFISLKYAKFNPVMGKMDVGPKNVKKYIKNSLTRLGLDYVDLYQPARIDIGIPLEDTIGAISDLIEEGCVKYLGVSEVEDDILRKVHSIHPVALVESEVSIINNEIDNTIIPVAEELGIGIVGFGALAFGKLFKNENDPLNVAIREIAKKRNVSISQIAHAWVLNKSDNMIVLIGSRKSDRLIDSMGSKDIIFTNDEITKIKSAMHDSKIMGRSMPKLVVKNSKIIR